VFRPALEGAVRGVEFIDQAVVSRRDDAMRRKAFDGERTGDADLGVVDVGTVVEVLHIGRASDRGIDLFLARDTRLPPGGMEANRLLIVPWIDRGFGQRVEPIVTPQ